MVSSEPKMCEMIPQLSQPKNHFPHISPSPLRPISLQASLSTHGNDNVTISTPQSKGVCEPLSPADCRTLKRLLQDARSPSPSSPSIDARVDGLFEDGGKDGSSDEGEEDVKVLGKSEELGDEMEGGYEDEDESMELSGDEDVESDTKDRDDIEDMMNLPGKVAPPAQPLNLSGVHVHEQTTPDDVKEMRARRAEIDKKLVEERLEQEHSNLGTSLTKNRFHEHELTPLLFSDLNSFMDTEPAVLQTPGGKHIEFAPNAAIPEDTPFTKTLNYFKQYKGKENPSSKSWHDTSLFEEVAEVAREAEDGDLEQYRDMDLAPLDMVMSTDVAGDLIMASTLVKTQTYEPILSKIEWPDTPPQKPSQYPPRRAELFFGWKSDCAIGHDSPQTKAAESSDKISRPLLDNVPVLDLGGDGKNDTFAKAEYPDNVSNPDQKQIILYPQHPTFVTVIGMLPAVMFWVTVAPIAKYSSKAFDMLVEKMTGLKV